MAQTVIGIFKDSAEEQNTRQHLQLIKVMRQKVLSYYI